MNKKLFSIFVLTFYFLGNMWVSAQNRWTSGQSVGGGTFYFYNIGANRYLSRGSSWDTHAILDGAGLPIEVSASINGGYLKTNVEGGTGCYLGFVDGNVWMNREQTEFVCEGVLVNGYTNAYILKSNVNGTTYYLGWAGGGSGEYANEVITTTTKPTNDNKFYWLLIRPQDREFDVTNNITNPDFERNIWGSWDKNADPTGWTKDGFQKMNTGQSFANAVFAEKWSGSALLEAGNCYQRISDLPAGTYTLTVTAQAINENNNNAPCTKGVYLYLGNNKTPIGAAGTYKVTTTHNGGDLELGVEIESGNNANWVAFDNVRLYKSDLTFSANSATVDNGTSSYYDIKLQRNGNDFTSTSGNVTFTTECYGNITNATVNSNGQITNISYINDADQGGAVVVHATFDGITPIATYVLTVAYTEHLWDFTQTISTDKPHGTPLNSKDILTNLRNNNDNWAVFYKVREYPNGVFDYFKSPVICNAAPIDGTNADYNEYTAGLTITAGAKSFGSDATIPDSYYTGDQIKDESTLGLPASEVQTATILTLNYGATLTIPSLKRGQYVRVKWQRYSKGHGDKVTLNNLSDLKGTPMDNAETHTDFAYTNNIRTGLNGEGYHVFKVEREGSVSFTVADDGWVNFYSIQVSNNFLDANCWLDMVTSHVGDMDTQLKFPNDTEYNSLKQSEIGNTTYTWIAQDGAIRGQQNISVLYSLEGLDGGSVSTTLLGSEIINDVNKVNGKVKISGKFKPVGHGQLVAVSEGFTYQITDDQFDVGNIDNVKKFYLDLQRTLITVNETGSTAQVYPYTWDFTNICDETKDRLVGDNQYWSGNVKDGFTPTDAYQKDFTENTEITTSSTNFKWKRSEPVSVGNDYYGFAEFDGIGFNTNPVDGYSTSLTSIKVTTDGTGLVVGNGTANAKDVTLNLPQVDAGFTVYVRVKEYDNSSITVGGVANVSYTDADEKVYTYTTTEKADVPVAVKNAEVKKIAVTNMSKTCWLKDGNSKNGDTYDYYNTDSHDHSIDYSLTEYFTGNEIKAYTVSGINEDNNTKVVNSVIISPIVLAPSGHGYVVSTKYASDPNQANSSQASLYKRPLFMPCVIDIQGRGKNQMGVANDAFLKPHIGSGSIAEDIDPSNTNSKVTGLNEDEYDFYVLTNKYYSIYDNTHQISTAEVPGFYRLENLSDHLAKNRAFLALRKPQNGSVGVKFISLYDFDGELVDAIDEIPAIATNGIDVNGTFYTLQGLKIEGYPQKGGIYIQNGKKVMVK